MSDLISREKAIDAVNAWLLLKSLNRTMSNAMSIQDVLRQLPSAQPERLTDDDFETIRIHLNSYKEKLCNQQRWEEAEEYQRIIDRFMAFASAQPDTDMIHLQKEQTYMQGYEDGQRSVREFIVKETTYSDFGTGQEMVGDLIRCKDCKHYNSYFVECESESGLKHISDHHQWCCNAERRHDEQTD